MRKKRVEVAGILSEGYKCPKCGKVEFTEKQMRKMWHHVKHTKSHLITWSGETNNVSTIMGRCNFSILIIFFSLESFFNKNFLFLNNV